MYATLLLLLALLIPTSARAVDITITIPASAIPNAQIQCEILRQMLQVRSADWTNARCAEEFLRQGLRAFTERTSRKVARQQAVDAVEADLVGFDTEFPVQQPAVCGDGVLDTEFGEQCDDGNTIDGDGCSSQCFNEP